MKKLINNWVQVNEKNTMTVKTVNVGLDFYGTFFILLSYRNKRPLKIITIRWVSITSKANIKFQYVYWRLRFQFQTVNESNQINSDHWTRKYITNLSRFWRRTKYKSMSSLTKTPRGHKFCYFLPSACIMTPHVYKNIIVEYGAG